MQTTVPVPGAEAFALVLAGPMAFEARGRRRQARRVGNDPEHMSMEGAHETDAPTQRNTR